MAVEDSLVIGALLAKVTSENQIPSAFAAMDQMRRPRTQKLVHLSEETGKLYDFELEGIEDDLAKIKEKVDPRYRWIWFEDMEKHVQEAEQLFTKLNGRKHNLARDFPGLSID